MEKLKFNEVYQQLESGKLSPYNFYNVDINIDQVFSIDHYLKNNYDTIEKTQTLKKVFLDIELFLGHNQGSSIAETVMAGRNLVNAVSQFYSSENCFYCYFVPPKGCTTTVEEFEDFLNKESNKPVKIGENKDGSDKFGTYFDEGQKVKVKLFDNGIDLVIDLWERIKKDDPAVLSGWNSDGFDFPYIYHYLLTHFRGDHESVAKVMSRFGEVYVDNGKDRAGNTIHWIRFPEYNIVDLLYCYKERKSTLYKKNKLILSVI